jgi:hypothetical protein
MFGNCLCTACHVVDHVAQEMQRSLAEAIPGRQEDCSTLKGRQQRPFPLLHSNSEKSVMRVDVV